MLANRLILLKNGIKKKMHELIKIKFEIWPFLPSNKSKANSFSFYINLDRMRKLFALLVFGMAIVLFACEEEDEDEDGGQSSSMGTSHNTGKNCLGCHKFTAAGSVYNKALTASYPGVTVKLTTQANGAGTVLATFTANKNGSFYTSSSINYGSGVYVSLTGTSGTVKHMASAINSGACNSCHGTSTSKIWAE
jgi:hypothetical protein